MIAGRTMDKSPLTSTDVLAWCMEQTCLAMETAQPLRIMQGLEFCRRKIVMDTHVPSSLQGSAVVQDTNNMRAFWAVIQEDESQTLNQMYGVHDGRKSTFLRLLDRQSKEPIMQHLVQEFDEVSTLTLEDSSMDNEQEREVAHEIERERQVQRPGQVKALTPEISLGLHKFIETGKTGLQYTQSGIFPAFRYFMSTSSDSIARQQQIHLDKFRLFNTQECSRSVVLISIADEFLRPVNWVHTSLINKQMVIISPHEANELLAQIKASKAVRLHVFAPKTNKKMAAFDSMDYYTPSETPNDLPASPQSIRCPKLFAGAL